MNQIKGNFDKSNKIFKGCSDNEGRESIRDRESFHLTAPMAHLINFGINNISISAVGINSRQTNASATAI